MSTQQTAISREELTELITELTKPPDGAHKDPSPATTREVVRLLGLLRSCGGEEMLGSIESNIVASIAAVAVMQKSVTNAPGVIEGILRLCEIKWAIGQLKAQGASPQTKGPSK